MEGRLSGADAYVKELDVLLKFCDEKPGCLTRFRPNIEARDTKRDEALNELRLAYLLENLGFPIIDWDPPGLSNMIGEFLIESPKEVRIFTEIKSPGWESDLSPAQIQAGRAKMPKYIGLEVGAVGNWQAVHRCLSSPKTYPKFTENQSNLLIISDDLKLSLFDSLFQVEGALYAPIEQYGVDGFFTTNQYENIGGLGVFNALSTGSRDGLEYKFVVCENRFASLATKLPPSLLKYNTPFSCYVRRTERRSGT